MPEISRFYGIIIQMFYQEHQPPYFHATYGEYRVEISILDLKVIAGEFPRKGLNLVLDWAELHKDELMREWELAQKKEPSSTPLPDLIERQPCEIIPDVPLSFVKGRINI